MRTIWTVLFFILFILFQMPAFAEGDDPPPDNPPPPPPPTGTVDQALLYPADLPVIIGTQGTTIFTALNDKSFELKTFEVVFSYSQGLEPYIWDRSPWATETIDTKKRLLKLVWSGVSPGTMLTAEIRLQSGATGVYTLTPTSVKYTDYSQHTYTAACNTAVLTVSLDTDPPAAPKIESSNLLGGVKIKLSSSNEPDLAGFDFYRRGTGGSYQPIQCAPFYDNVCTDTSVAAGQTYYYAAKARDTSGNVSPFSKETATTYIPPALLASLNFNADSAAGGDLNGDGYRDLVLGQVYFTKNKGGRVAVFWGRAGGGFNSSPGFTIASPEVKDEFGRSLAVVDLNNDGYDDLVVGAPGHNEPKTYPVNGIAYQAGQIYVFAGGPQLSDTPVFAMPGGWAYNCSGSGVYTLLSERWGEKISPAGDVNGDGYQDVVIGVPNGGKDRSGRIIILRGGSTIAANTTVLTNPNCGAEFGKYVAPAGDVNGDGYGEVLAASNSGIHMIMGGASPQMPMNTFCCSSDSMIGLDYNGDGYSDVFAGSYLYYGAESWNPVQYYLRFSLAGPTAAADVNGDGFQDWLSASGYIYLGNAGGDYLADVQFELQSNPILIRGIADANGDGIPDPIFLGSDGYLKVYSLAPLLTLPEIAVTSHRNGDNSASNRIEGFVAGNPVRLFVDGIETPIQPDGSFSVELPLSTGSQTIEVLAEAADGRLGKRVLSFYYYQPLPLTLAITSPADGTVVNDPSLHVIGSANYSLTTATVNGVTATISYSVLNADVTLTEGANIITAEVVDIHGRAASTNITVHLLTTGELAGTVTDASSGSPMPNVSVAVTDAQGNPYTTQTDNDGIYSMAGLHQGPFTAAFGQAGYFTFSASGTITAGQTSTLDAVLTPYPPLGLTISSPTDGQTVNETPITVTGTVTNGAAVTVNGITAMVGGGAFTAEVSLAEGANAIAAAAVDQYNQTAAAGVTVSLVYLPPTVNISANPTSSVLPRQPSTLSWTSTDAQTATIEPEVGPVAPNGSVIVKPAQTTTYTITVTGPGGTAADTVTVDVIPSTLAVNLTAEPSSIPVGTSATLTWTSTDAQTANIEPGVGPVAPNGSVVVTPLDTITYTISATGLDGTVVDSTTVAVIHPAPTVTISAAPESIKVGQAVTLSWTSANADTCEIDQGVGPVELNGMAAVTPMETTVFTITATGPGGTASANVTVDVDNPFAINIISPTDLSAFNRPDVPVYGTVTNVWGSETAVTVNGQMGLKYEDRFAANHVALSDGANTITVTATDEEGYRYSKSITVYANTAVDYVRLDPSPSEGAAGLESVLTVNGNVQITSSDFDWQGPAPVIFSAQSANSTTASMVTPGLYFFTVEAHDAAGNTYPDAAAVGVWDNNDLDALLRNKWGRLKTALAAGDVATAVACHKEKTRAGYEEIYTDLQDRLPSIVQNMGAITPVSIESNRAEYIIERDDLIDGQIVTLTFSIYFSRDENGIWWLERY
jgi:hypothetical protein